MKIIIIGGKGLIAKNILTHLSACHKVITVDIDEWDIADKEKGKEFLQQYLPDAVINLAAITNVDGCEDSVELARIVNGEAPGFIAEACEKYHVKLVHLSTDYVFNGKKGAPYTEEDTPDPQSVYGMTKLAGERNVMEKNPSSLIIRAQWLYGDGGENFITKITKIADEKGMVEVVDDQRGMPTYAKDLALPLKTLIENNNSGIYHIANRGSCTWFEFAREIFSQLHMEIEVKPITSARLNRRARRPVYSVYDCSKFQRDTGIVMRSWQEALKEYLS
ncbi:MAG: dTDP-4-dehydrorhamnose reductase [Proteobacteria bacterium]|nr:dTDP-4-dehydrorhamnose reductase [Pseudomonadota bacterium]